MLKSNLKQFFFLFFLFLIHLTAPVKADDFPTIDRVLYVNECVRKNGGGLDSLYKCSCVMAYFTKNLTYQEFDKMDASSHGIQTTGERSALWRDPKEVRDGIKRLKDVEKKAKQNCNLGGE